MSKAPAFQFYANDFMDSTRFMEANAVGLYVRCLCIQWTQGGLPKDARTLSKGVGMDFEEFERAWPAIASKFEVCDDGLLRNRRLEAVRSRQEEISSKRSNAGKAGAIAKANASANESAKNKQRKVKEKEKVEGEEEVRRVDASAIEIGPSDPYPADFPPSMRTDAALSAWNDWEKSRKERGKPITSTARRLQLADCAAWGTDRAIAAMKHSTKGNYQGLFEPSQPNHNGTHAATLKTANPNKVHTGKL